MEKTFKDAWDRWSAAWHGLFFMLCFMSLMLVIFDPTNPNPVQPTVLTGLLIVWYSTSMRLPTLSSLGYAGYFAVGWAIWYALSGYNLAFFFVLGGLFPHVFKLVPLPLSIGFALILNVLVLLQLRNVNGDLTAMWMIVVIIAWISGALLAYFITDIIRQSRKRQDLIDQLQAAQTRIAEMQRQAGIAYERQRLAGELHDTIAQGLIGIVTHLEAAEASPTEAERYVNGAKTLARENLGEVRRFIWELRPPALEGHLFEEGLRMVATGWTAMSRIPAEVVITGTPLGLTEAQEVALLRVTQEALANVGKHAQARRVTITLSYVPQAILLDINDDGVGFTPPGTGFGLMNMRGRVEALGGTLSIESAVGEGATLAVEMPMHSGGNT